MCDGDWEHQGGITIQTVDNPGWVITLHLEDIIIEPDYAKKLSENQDEYVEINYFSEENAYRIFCEPLNLTRALNNVASILTAMD